MSDTHMKTAKSTGHQFRVLQLMPLLGVLILFMVFTTIRLDLPGLHYDEALEAGLPAVQILNGSSITTVSGGTFTFLGRELPLMVQNHIGALQVYAALPFVWLGGPTPESLRAMTVLSGLMTIIATYAFVAQVYGRTAAIYASLWLGTYASFVFWSRQGAFITSLAPCFAMCAFAIGAYWWRTQHWWAAGLTGLCAGLAIYSKLNALWLLTAMCAWVGIHVCVTLLQSRHTTTAAGIVHRATWRRIAADWPTMHWRTFGAGVAGLLVGCWPLLWYNLQTASATFRVIQLNATETYLGANNSAILANLQTRLVQFADVIASGEHLWYLGGAFPNHVAVVSILIASLVLVVRVIQTRGGGWQSTLLAPFLCLAVIVQSCYTISALWPTHFAVATPLPAIIFGVSMSVLHTWNAKYIRWASLRRFALVCTATLIILLQVGTTVRYLNSLITSGGLSFHSSAIYDFSHFLDQRSEHIVALDWGIATQVEYLTGGRKVIEEWHGYEQEATPEFVAGLHQRLNPSTLYLTHAEHQEAFQRRGAFLQTIDESPYQTETINVSTRADGWPLLEVWKIEKP
ncbi:MAG: glycosyltransferase family 39 protein [Chloroflexota bacterium]